MSEDKDAIEKLEDLVETLLDLGFNIDTVNSLSIEDAVNLYRLNRQMHNEC